MSKYSVHCFCNECGDVHAMGISMIDLDDGPADRSSIGDTYAGKEVPTNLLTLTQNRMTCPKTGKLTSQKDNNQVFLVRVA